MYVYRQLRKDSITAKTQSKSIESLIGIIKYWYYYNYNNEYIKKLYYNYLAYQYTILLSIMNNKNSTKMQKNEIDKYRDLLLYDMNYKVKICNKVLKIFKMRVGVLILKFYILLKNNGLIKL